MSIVFKIKEFFKEVWVELRRVSWLSNKDIMKYTGIVLAAVVVSAIFLGGLDYVFTSIIKKIIIR